MYCRLLSVVIVSTLLGRGNGQDVLSSYLKAFKAKRTLQQDIVKSLSQENHSKQEELLKLIYEAMHGVISSSFNNLQSFGFTSHSSFPEEPHVSESLSLVYENCALFADLYLRYPDLTESLYNRLKTANFKEMVTNSINFCHERKDVYQDGNDNGKLLKLVRQELGLLSKDPDYRNPYRKVLSVPEPRTPKKKEKKKLPRGPNISKSEL